MNLKNLIDQISAWIEGKVSESGCRGVVLGLSGGLDSSVVLGLASRALGDKTLGVIMPCHSIPQDTEHAELAAARFKAEVINTSLDSAFSAMMNELPECKDRLTQANVKARLRMTALYYMANDRRYLVAGTGNRSELATGYFTKYGDGASDILPIGSLLKTQVRKLARVLGVPDVIIDKPPSAGLWEGQTDEDEMGIDYETLDSIIAAIDSGRIPKAPEKQVKLVRSRMRAAVHKLNPPCVFIPDSGVAES